ncbi:sterol O-acyltransferase 1-like [Actinia tenebrosa]|uniref:O-acyltransferase n=1 Tax=Actinia tenebrosa TaxID=6105 RepID=A0A6P8IUB9_ACTTE|nr:sterol O-acyltransferase 1-like [Actinia tenebrosa]
MEDGTVLRQRNHSSTNGGMASNHFDEIRDSIRTQELRRRTDQLRTDILEQIDGQLSDLFDDVIQGVEKPDEISDRFTDKSNGSKIFKARHSVLTELLQVCHIRTIYNIFVALLFVFVLNTIVYDFIDTGSIILDFSVMAWAFGKASTVINIWLVMNIMAFLVFPMFYFWHKNSCSWLRIPNKIWLIVYVAFIVLFIVFPIQEICLHDLPPVSSIIVSCEQIRLILKVHAFVRSNAPKVIAMQKKTKKERSPKSIPEEEIPPKEVSVGESNLPDFGQYLYFLFCPTLVYRDQYPMTPCIKWDYVVSNFLQVIGCILYTYYVFVRFCVPVFRNTGKEPGNFKQLILSSFSCMLPGTMVLVLGFFAILHSWLNAFAEMTRFADRMFYKDWWNAPSYANWYRTWNVVVHDWLFNYIYKDILLFTANRNLATTIVFLSSALVHEYVLFVSFRFFFPILFAMFGGIGLSFVFVKPQKRENVSQAWNIFMWVTLFLGNGLLMCLYSQEWYAVQNCPRTSHTLMDQLIPRSWSSECTGHGHGLN